MRFKATITGWYELGEPEMLEERETTDAEEFARLEEQGLDPEELLGYLENVSISVDPA